MTQNRASWLESNASQSFLVEASERLASARSMPAVVEVLRDTARGAIGADGIAVVLKDGDQCSYVAEDAIAPLWSGRRFPADQCISGWSMQHVETVIVSDVRADPRIPQTAYEPTFVRSLAMVRIGRPDPVAALGAYWSTTGPPPEGSIARLESLGRLAAIAVENARLLDLNREDARLKATMLAAGRMGLWSFDVASGTLDASAACRKNFGRDPALPFTYEDLQSAIHPDDREWVNAAIAASLTTRCEYDVEYRVLAPDGDIRWIGVRGQPSFRHEGTPIGLSGVSIDITERKRMEEALRTSAATLEHLVEERTRELVRTQDALRQSQKLEAMGQLTGGVAHDFNNLLTPIIGSLDLLHRRQVGSEREQRLISGALQSADRARVLVQRLLAFARRQPLHPEPVDMAALVIGMSELIGTTVGPQVELRLDLAAELPMAVADPHQVEMALLNLSVNARDAMPDGGSLVISAHLQRTDHLAAPGIEPGDYVVVSVSDTGLGMDADTQLRSIEPFFSTKGIGQGTGLGLSMAHGLARQLGGALTIESEPGSGTSIALWFPATGARQTAITASSNHEMHGSGVALVVDDEPLVRASTADMLVDLGFEVLEAASGHEALALIKSDARICVMISDHLMPHMTGVELVRAALAIRPSLPVLIVSGYSDAIGLASDLPRLSKPFRQAELSIALEKIMPAKEAAPIIVTVVEDPLGAPTIPIS
ncbi:two-component sensor histidine kinase [Sphingomonas sp. LH128]|uniref:hybrid sensor histidine kinase/response regulator n=1 Tax=Sphingomonas sp. LH128 TaxID=473781 RepID=UPI00027CAEF1|nr:PAS domain-containing sensor histidine kinase [Sphingomonas sp. LH128]EJU09589.1 two-component sensor histidine kinase [Sphingomonas sp. LH128]